MPNETAYTGIELLVVAETPVDRQWQFLDALRQSGEQGNLGIPAARPDDETIKGHMAKALKGNGYAARLINLCDVAELPASITGFLDRVYADFPRPEPAPLPPAKGEAAEAAQLAAEPAAQPADPVDDEL